MRWICAACVAVALALGPGCVGQIGDPVIGQGPVEPTVEATLLAPSRVEFEPVAKAMQPHCGTLDCHGQIGRNLRLYGARGLRLDRQANPADGDTTPAELDASYWSVLGLEPEALTQVVRDHGAAPERLSLIRKARGDERHKGGQLMLAGDDLDSCLVAWVAGAGNAAACGRAAKYGNPQSPMQP